MPLQIKVDDTQFEVKIISQEGHNIEISIDGRVYNLDVERIHAGSYSILNKNKSYNIDLIQGQGPRHYLVNMAYSTYDVNIIDAQARYLESRHKSQHSDSHNEIVSPMPGKVVKVLVKEGDAVLAGQPLIVISAMKMESEYKAGVDGVVTKINCQAGDTVEANKALIVIDAEVKPEGE